MTKATKATVLGRIGDVLRLLLAGAEFNDIWQYSSRLGWKVSKRQVRRYIESAYKQMAGLAWRNRQQLLGRHLMQRRALYARSLKAGDNRTALRVLQDEASLEGLYPAAKASSSALDGEYPYTGPEGPALSRKQRVIRLLVAEANEDHLDQRLMQQITPTRKYWLPDTTLPSQMLNVMAMIYVAEQLDLAALFVTSMFCRVIGQDERDDQELIGILTSHRFRLGREAWHRFCEELRFDGDQLVENNHSGIFLNQHTDKICELAPTPQELHTAIDKLGVAKKDLAGVDHLVRRWRHLFDQVCPD